MEVLATHLVPESLRHYTVSSKESRELEEVSKAMEVSILRPGNMKTNPGPRLQRFLTEVGTGSDWQGVEINRTSADDDNFNNLKLRLTNSFFLEPCKDFESEDAARREWLDRKILVARRYRHLDSQVLWQRLIQGAIGRGGQFQHMQVVAEISLVLPMSSSCCERGFSCMKRTKRDQDIKGAKALSSGRSSPREQEYRSLDAGRRNDYRRPTSTGDNCTTRPRHTKKDPSDVLLFPTTPLSPVGKGRNIADPPIHHNMSVLLDGHAEFEERPGGSLEQGWQRYSPDTTGPRDEVLKDHFFKGLREGPLKIELE
ncbi:unnamed protein product [Gadus morhua 'NCC']